MMTREGIMQTKLKEPPKIRVKNHREKLKLDPTKYEEAKRKDRERKKLKQKERKKGKNYYQINER
jgi:hypothetical protein